MQILKDTKIFILNEINCLASCSSAYRLRCTDCFFPTVLYRKQLLPMSILLRSESDSVSLLKASREEKVNRYKPTYGWYSLEKT